MTEAPKIDNAPGLVFRPRKAGWTAYWQARTDLAERGFKPTTVPLWRGSELSAADVLMMQDACQQLQAEMLVWGRGGLPIAGAFDGTIASLIRCYQTDADSSFRKNRYRTRENYGSLCRRIERDHGDERIEEVRPRDVLRWHEEWSTGGKIPMAHSLIGMFRGLLSFGMVLLEDEACEQLSIKLSKRRFKMGQPRSERLTAEQADLIRAEAHRRELPSIALAQAIQFECMLRQKDVIGEWVPDSEPGLSDVMHDGEKWLRGLRWNEIDANLILRHITSKRQKMVEHDLSVAGMVVEELARIDRPTSGPVIIHEETGRPYVAHKFRSLWREIARACGIPDAVRNQDSRAGGITEATEAGAPLESIKHAAAHSDIAQTQKYARAPAEKTRNVAVMRAAHRKNKSGT